MTRRFAFWLAGVLFAATGAFVCTAAADDVRGGDSPMTVTEEVLLILKQAGRISDTKHRELLDRHHREMAEVAAAAASSSRNASTPPVSAAAHEDPEAWHVKWRNGLRLERNDGYHKLRIGGRFENDWTVVGYSDGAARSIGMTQGRVEGGTEIRRARIFFEGTLWDRIGFKAQYDFADEDAQGSGKNEFKDMWISMNGLGPLGTLTVGYLKEPFSLEELNSGKDITFMERGLPNALVPNRATGVQLMNAPLEERMTWALGVFREVDDVGRGFGKNAPYNITGRVTGLPLWSSEGRRYVHLGASYSHQFRTGSATAGYQSRPEANQARNLVDTMDLATNGQDLLGTEAVFVWGPWLIQSEFVGSWLHRKSDSNPFFWGAYAKASYFLTGEHRPYSAAHGIMGRIEPRNSFNPAKGQWGAWELALRYSHLDLTSSGVSGGVLNDVTVGLNWYLFDNLRWFVNYVFSDKLGAGSTNLAQMRFLIYY